MKLQHKEELDELTTMCEQLESKCAEKVKEYKYVRVLLYSWILWLWVHHSLQEKKNQTNKGCRGCDDSDKAGSIKDKEILYFRWRKAMN